MIANLSDQDDFGEPMIDEYNSFVTESCYKIATFYKFLNVSALGDLHYLRDSVRAEMKALDIVGTFILAGEGFNSTVCGLSDEVDNFIDRISKMFSTEITAKFSSAALPPFKKIDAKVKPEIVTLKRPVDVSLGDGTHVAAEDWNRVISDPEVLVLDTRNDYEFRTGTFEQAVNPGTEKFSDLPAFVAEALDPEKHKKVAMFCTGGIRCEKFAPYMKSLGFEQVFQLEGGILKYLERVPPEEQLWQGKCYVFDTRVAIDEQLRPGADEDLSQTEK